MFRSVAAFAFVAVGFMGSSSAFAQSLQTGTITGKVSDNTGARAAGVVVTAVSPVLITARMTTTDGQGGYAFPWLPPGRYAVSFELQGFRKLTRSEVLVNVAVVEEGW